MNALHLNQQQIFPTFDIQTALNSVIDTIASYKENYLLKKKIKNLQNTVMQLTASAHEANAKAQTIRDFIELYEIHNIDKDLELLNVVDDEVSQLKDEVENIIDTVDIKSIDNIFKTTLLDAYEELYSTLVNIEFSISQKTAQAYLDSKSDSKLLQEA